MSPYLAPQYKWRCLKCRRFIDPEGHLLLSTIYDIPLRLCPNCERPLSLVRVTWRITRPTKKNP